MRPCAEKKRKTEDDEGEDPALNHVDAAKVLIDRGAQVDARNKDGVTPLAVAKRQGHGAMEALLRQHDAAGREEDDEEKSGGDDDEMEEEDDEDDRPACVQCGVSAAWARDAASSRALLAFAAGKRSCTRRTLDDAMRNLQGEISSVKAVFAMRMEAEARCASCCRESGVPLRFWREAEESESDEEESDEEHESDKAEESESDEEESDEEHESDEEEESDRTFSEVLTILCDDDGSMFGRLVASRLTLKQLLCFGLVNKASSKILRENLYKLLLCCRDVMQDPGELGRVGKSWYMKVGL